jgi:thioredoxin reductase (NADPH)
MFIRKGIVDQMSTYLIERIKALPNVTLCEGCEVVAVHGDKRLEAITYRDGNGKLVPMVKMDQMYIFIGATPRTFWLKGCGIQMDKNNFILTDGDLSTDGMTNTKPLRYETSMHGVFAAGDVRANNTKRIAAAIGEGGGAVPMIHRYLAMLEK